MESLFVKAIPVSVAGNRVKPSLAAGATDRGALRTPAFACQSRARVSGQLKRVAISGSRLRACLFVKANNYWRKRKNFCLPDKGAAFVNALPPGAGVTSLHD